MNISFFDSKFKQIANELSLAHTAIGFRSGHQIVSFVSRSDHLSLRRCINRTWTIQKTVFRACSLLGRVEINHTATIIGAGLLLSYANLKATSYQHLHSPLWRPLWDCTPIIVSTANIALLALEFQFNPSKVYIAVAAISLTILAPQKMEMLELPMTLISFYYGSNLLKTEIAIELIARAFFP